MHYSSPLPTAPPLPHRWRRSISPSSSYLAGAATGRAPCRFPSATLSPFLHNDRERIHRSCRFPSVTLSPFLHGDGKGIHRSYRFLSVTPSPFLHDDGIATEEPPPPLLPFLHSPIGGASSSARSAALRFSPSSPDPAVAAWLSTLSPPPRQIYGGGNADHIAVALIRLRGMSEARHAHANSRIGGWHRHHRFVPLGSPLRHQRTRRLSSLRQAVLRRYSDSRRQGRRGEGRRGRHCCP